MPSSTWVFEAMIKIEAIPFPLEWQPGPQSWTLESGTLSASAGPQTDLFVDPLGKVNVHNAPMLVFEAQGDFMLSSQVEVDFQSTFDAGVLVIYQNPNSWAKLCFEYSPQGQPMIVSVVTKGTSDDCNSVVMAGNQVYLRMAKIGDGFAFHYSGDAKIWHLVRVFRLEAVPTKAGFLVQSPTGQGCTATFSGVAFHAQRLGDIRSGT